MEGALPLIGAFLCLAIIGVGMLAAYATHMAVKANIEICGMRGSTHAVQFVPVEPTGDDDGESAAFNAELRRRERKDFEAAGDLDDETYQ